MKSIKFNKSKIVLELTNDELGVLSNALNEVCNGIKVLNFEKTIGIDIDAARGLLKSLTLIYKEES